MMLINPYAFAGAAPPGQIAYTTEGTHNFVVPAGITRVSVAICGAGGGAALYRDAAGIDIGTGAGAGAGLCWFTLKVVAGDNITLGVSGPVFCASTAADIAQDGEDGGITGCFLNGALVAYAYGGKGGRIAAARSDGGTGQIFNWSVVDDTLPYGISTGGRGGYGENTLRGRNGGGGGAPGYTDFYAPGGDGAYGGHTGPSMGVGSSAAGGTYGRGGGGIGMFGAGARGTSAGKGGSGGQDGDTARGGNYGGGLGAFGYLTASQSGGGFARLIWGEGRYYPSTGVADV